MSRSNGNVICETTCMQSVLHSDMHSELHSELQFKMQSELHSEIQSELQSDEYTGVHSDYNPACMWYAQQELVRLLAPLTNLDYQHRVNGSDKDASGAASGAADVDDNLLTYVRASVVAMTTMVRTWPGLFCLVAPMAATTPTGSFQTQVSLGNT